MEQEDYPRSDQEFWTRFGSEKACWEYLCYLRWPDGFECPECQSRKCWLNQKRLYECIDCGHRASVIAGTVFQDSKLPLKTWFAAMWEVVSSRGGISAKSLQERLGLGSYRTAWTMLHKLRRAMIRPGRDRLRGTVEVDETYVGGEEAGRKGRGAIKKTLVCVAVEVFERKPGRVRLRVIADASSASLLPFVQENVEPGSCVVTDGWEGYGAVKTAGYLHEPRTISGSGKKAHELLPCVHLIDSLLKRWLLGTHQGAVMPEQLAHYLNEYAFRFNRRLSNHRGKLFYRLVGQCLEIEPQPYKTIVARPRKRKTHR